MVYHVLDMKRNTTETNASTGAVIDEKEAARRIGLSVSFLRQSRIDGDLANRTPGPPFLKMGKAVRYLVSDLDSWLLSHRREPGR